MLAQSSSIPSCHLYAPLISTSLLSIVLSPSVVPHLAPSQSSPVPVVILFLGTLVCTADSSHAPRSSLPSVIVASFGAYLVGNSGPSIDPSWNLVPSLHITLSPLGSFSKTRPPNARWLVDDALGLRGFHSSWVIAGRECST